MTGNFKRLTPTVVLNETKFGWTLHGRFSNVINSANTVGAMHVSVWEENNCDTTAIELQRFWELESLGIRDEPKEIKSCNEQTLKQFEENIKFKNGRYEVKLPMKYQTVDLPNNYDVAKRRFELLIKRFQRDHTLFNDYKNVIEEYKSLGIVETVEPQNINSIDGNLTYYLPHHPVIRKDKQTTKLRIVFDASAHSPSQPSLNDVLLSGPNLNSDLFDLILQFRSNKIAVVSDVQRAFLEISLSETDRDLTRFLWIDELPHDKHCEVKPIIMKMTRVLFGVTSSPFLLGAVIKHHVRQFEKQYPETCSMINSSMYVDDLLIGASTVKEALKLSNESHDIFSKANMLLRKWQSNSSVLKKHLQSLNFDVCSETPLYANPFKILGLIWDTERDFFKFDNHNLSEFVNCQEKTKRTVIQAAGRIFDPVGFLSPFTVIIKIIFQSLWEQGIDWDQNLPENLETKWDKWCSQLPFLSKIEVPRYYFSDLQGAVDNVELHCFCDASERAYGAVIYLRFDKDNDVKTAFVTSKNRLAPIKRLTLPRLELMGTIIGARLVNRVMSTLNFSIKRQYLWTDSNIVLHWIKSSSSAWKPFVSNRVAEIQLLTNPKDWQHCPGRTNPADRLTRGLLLTDLEKDKLWWSGPPWILENAEFWPREAKEVEDDLKQEEARGKSIVQNFSATDSHEPLIIMDRFSSLTKVIRTAAWIKRFIHNLRNSPKREGTLSAEELREAGKLLIKEVQLKNYKEEIESLAKNESIKKNSKIYSLYPYLDDSGLLRLKGRLNEGDFEPDEINPILLPNKERYTELLILQVHQDLMHSGVSLTLSQIRKQFWITKGRQAVKKIIGKCLICKKYSARPTNQLTGQLPRDRISTSPPFDICGTDFAGPIFVKNGQETSKSYIALFICAVTRACHLELVSDMTTKSFLLAFRRFVSRRGNCSIVYSDNAKTFKSSKKELKFFADICRDKQFQDFISVRGITWKFIMERAPWWGGFYERLVKSVKDPLRKVLGRALLTFEELTTVLSEIEAVLNLRPISFVYNDLKEPEPLTPAQFLHFGKKSFEYPLTLAHLESKISTKENLVRRKMYQTKLLGQLWLRWKREYLFNLRTVHHFKTAEVHKELNVGDVVLVDGVSKSKFLWDLGVVEELFRGRDGHVRSCVIKTSKGKFRRPVQLLYPLELGDCG